MNFDEFKKLEDIMMSAYTLVANLTRDIVEHDEIKSPNYNEYNYHLSKFSFSLWPLLQDVERLMQFIDYIKTHRCNQKIAAKIINSAVEKSMIRYFSK